MSDFLRLAQLRVLALVQMMAPTIAWAWALPHPHMFVTAPNLRHRLCHEDVTFAASGDAGGDGGGGERVPVWRR